MTSESFKCSECNMTVSEFIKSLGIIPVVFLGYFSYTFSSVPIANLLVQKLCSPNGPPENINQFICHDEHIVSQATDLVTIRNILRITMTAISTIIFGLYRDMTGRSKPLILMGELGELVGVIMYMLGAYYWSMSPWVSIGVESVIAGLSGNTIFGMGFECYVIANTNEEDRTMRLQHLLGGVLLAVLLSSSCGGFILAAAGYERTYAIAVFLHIITIFFIIFMIRDKDRDNKNEETYNLLKHLKGIFESKPNNGVFWTMLFSGTFMATLYSSELMISTYYHQQVFNMSIEESSICSSYSLLVSVIGSFIFPALFTKVFKLSDFTVGIIAATVTAISSFAIAFVKSIVVLYLITTLNCMKYILNSIPSSIASRCITHNELGLYMGFASLASIFLPFGISYLYRSVFNATIKTMPGSFFFITSGSCVILSILIWICSRSYIEPKEEQIDDSTNCGNEIKN